MALSRKTEKYNCPILPDWAKNEPDFHLPDSVLGPFLDIAKPHIKSAFEKDLNRYRADILEPRLTLQESLELVVAAFENFDPRLGAKARAIIADPTKWQLSEAPPGKAGGRITETHSRDGKIQNGIQYAHDGTINDSVYIAHELGHLMAYDFAEDAGLHPRAAFGANPPHLWETQGFFGQHILYDHLMSQTERLDLKKASTLHFVGEISRSLYEWPILLAQLKLQREEITDHLPLVRKWLGDDGDCAVWNFDAQMQDANMVQDRSWQLHGGHMTAAVISAGIFQTAKDNPEKRKKIVDALLIQSKKKRHILDVLEAAGVETDAGMQNFAETAVKQVLAPLDEMAKDHLLIPSINRLPPQSPGTPRP